MPSGHSGERGVVEDVRMGAVALYPASPMSVELRRNGLQLAGTPLFLDATRKAPLSFVRPAHADHIGRHERTIATAATLRFMTHRLGKVHAPLPAPYGRPFDLGPLSLELLPAGHILGSAQLRVIREDGKRIVYTGDLNLVPSLTAEPAQVAECDLLVIESTFGHPRYAFPPREEVFGQVETWVRRHLERGAVPVLLGYSLGKSQEAMKYLSGRGFSLVAHASIHEVALLYGELGVPIERMRCFDGRVEPGEVLFFPAACGAGRGALVLLAPGHRRAHGLGHGRAGGRAALRRGRGLPGVRPRRLRVARALREGHGRPRHHPPPRLRRGTGPGDARRGPGCASARSAQAARAPLIRHAVRHPSPGDWTMSFSLPHTSQRRWTNRSSSLSSGPSPSGTPSSVLASAATFPGMSLARRDCTKVISRS